MPIIANNQTWESQKSKIWWEKINKSYLPVLMTSMMFIMIVFPVVMIAMVISMVMVTMVMVAMMMMISVVMMMMWRRKQIVPVFRVGQIWRAWWRIIQEKVRRCWRKNCWHAVKQSVPKLSSSPNSIEQPHILISNFHQSACWRCESLPNLCEQYWILVYTYMYAL